MAKILLVDDHKGIREKLANLLRREKHEVATAIDGEDALRQFSDSVIAGNEFVLIITDLEMPSIDGLRLAAAIKSSKPHIPIILLTGSCPEEKPDIVDAMISKGVLDLDHVLKTIEQLTALP